VPEPVLARKPGLRLQVQVLQLLARGLWQVQVLEREPVQREVPLSALPVIRWTQPYTVFFLLSAY
jgi:hypothetical protein